MEDYREIWAQRKENIKTLLIDILRLSFRIGLIVFNEFAVILIILSTDLGSEGGLGLAKNFTSIVIICELDDIVLSLP
jgi:hypothetical protein